MHIVAVMPASDQSAWELLDSRWNGNEAFRWTTDKGPFFVKLNRVEDLSVFMTEVRAPCCVVCPSVCRRGSEYCCAPMLISSIKRQTEHFVYVFITSVL